MSSSSLRLVIDLCPRPRLAHESMGKLWFLQMKFLPLRSGFWFLVIAAFINLSWTPPLWASWKVSILFYSHSKRETYFELFIFDWTTFTFSLFLIGICKFLVPLFFRSDGILPFLRRTRIPASSCWRAVRVVSWLPWVAMSGFYFFLFLNCNSDYKFEFVM